MNGIEWWLKAMEKYCLREAERPNEFISPNEMEFIPIAIGSNQNFSLDLFGYFLGQAKK